MRRLICSLLLVFASVSHAQKAGFFSVQSSAPGNSLRLTDMDLEIGMDGPFAETTLDVGYYNDSNQALQGLFKIQLPEGAVIRDFALKLGDKWQFGTLTEKHKARTTFEEIVRRGADPAVLAWSNGTEYQVRIFPFPMKGKRFIRIRYWQDLQGEAGKFTYALPLPSGVKLDSFRLKMNARAGSLEGIRVGEGYSNMVYMRPSDKGGFGAIVDEKNLTLPGELRVSALQSKSPVWTGQTTPQGDMTYVGARFFAELPVTTRHLAPKLLVFLDTSRSAKADRPAEVARFIKSAAALYKNVSYYEFDANVRRVTALNPESTSYDGGTDFAKLLSEVETQAKSGAVDAVVLSDAQPTIQREADFDSRKIANAKIFVLPVKSRFNPHFASLLAEKTGGSVLPAEIQAAERTFTVAQWHVEGLHYDEGTLSDSFPESGAPLKQGESIPLYFRSKPGRLPRQVTLSITNGIEKRELKADLQSPPQVPEVENLWAMKKLMDLVPHGEEFAQDLAAHANRYKLVSPVTSYIVLENDWDYQRFGLAKREENNQPSPVTAMEGAGGAMNKGRAGAIPPTARLAAPADGANMMMEQEVASDSIAAAPAASEPPPPPPTSGFFERRARKRALQMPVQTYLPYHPSLDGAITATQSGTHYATGYLVFGRLDKLYADQNTPEMKDAWFFVEMAQAYAAKGQKQKALRVISNLFEISEEDGRAVRTMGLVGCIAGDCDMAIAAFKLAMALRPEEPQNYRDLAWLYAELGRVKEAQALLASLRGKQFHSRFPGMDQLIAREAEFMDSLVKGEPRSPAGQDGRVYTWITWNNDNSDVDFHIRENQQQTVWYQNRRGQGELSNDFTQGYGPEVYTARDNVKPEYFAHYFRADQTTESQALVVKFANVEKVAGGKVVIRSHVFPLYVSQQYVKID